MIAEFLFGPEPSFNWLALEFLLSAVFVLVFATRLSKYADALERGTEISAVWIGAIFLAIVTSLPEAVTSVGAALMEDAMDLGVANLFGSNTFNLFILVVLDGLQGGGPILLTVQSGLLVAAAAGIALMGLAGMAIGFHQHEAATDVMMWVGPVFSAAILLAYGYLSRLTTKELPIPNTADESGAGAVKSVYSYSRMRIVMRLGMYSVLLIGVAIWLLRVCDAMAMTPIHLGARELILGRTVTGTFLLSAATSLPELFVCVAALRLGQTNMAVANLLGSNMANMCFVPIMHAVAWKTSFYADVDASSILVLISVAILMTAILMLGLMVRSKKSFLILGWEALAMLGVYLAGAYLVLRMGLGVGG